MKLTRPQRANLEAMVLRGTLQSGWGGYNSTLVVRLLAENGLATVKIYPRCGKADGWDAQATSEGRRALESHGGVY